MLGIARQELIDAPSLTRVCRKTGCNVKIAGMKLLSEDRMDALSLNRERIRVWVGAPLPDRRTHWRRGKILIRGDLSRSACTLSPTLSRKTKRERGQTQA